MTVPETVQEYSRYAAQSFIQTAVFVDDRIYERATSPHESKKVSSPKSRKPAIKPTIENQKKGEVSEIIAVDDEGGSPDTYDIVNSFSKKQIVCALYQPKQKAKVSPNSDIFPLCKAADVVIVDWDLYGDKGKRALELINGLIMQAVQDVPEQLRLVIIYTQESNLFGVANEIYEKVHSTIGDSLTPIDEERGLTFHTVNSRIVVLGKPGRERADTDPRHIVDEKDLADAAVREFAELASGVLHAAALLGLAEIRKKSRKILSKFSRDLDPAFFTHLAMGLPEEHASSHVIPLLVSEIEAVLEDALPNPLLPEKLVQDWCRNVWAPGPHLDQLLNAKGLDHRGIAEAICTEGFKNARAKFDSVPNINDPKEQTKKVRKAAKILLSSESSEENHRFSHLMASRTFYGNHTKALTMGTVVFDEKNDRYLLCVQPICDCVRLKKTRVFMFVELIKQENTGNSASHVIFKQGEPAIELIYQPKSYLCTMVKFSPDLSSQRVVAEIAENDELLFIDMDKNKYRWIDQLRTSHAQRAVERLASDLSRVGLTESEWMRRIEKNS